MLRRRKLKVKYRETVYRAMEKLADSGLIEKYYDRERTMMTY
jgi:Fe2+ or Zn2+ uptake regulation protein